MRLRSLMRLLPILALLMLSASVWAQTVSTDKLDYYPGEVVQITGSGFHPNETVTLEVDATDGFGWEFGQPWTVQTDANGGFTSTWFVINEALNRAFILTADCEHPGPDPAHLQAVTYFTDAGAFSYSPGSTSLSVNAGASVSFVQTVTAPANNGNFSATVQVAGTGVNPIPATWVTTMPTSLSFSTGSGMSATTDTKSWTVIFTVPPGASPGIYTADIKADPSITGVGRGAGTSVTLTVNGNQPPVLNAIGPKTVDEGTTLTFTATATDPNAGQTLTFSLMGAPAGASITSGGVFTWTPTEAQGPGTYNVTVVVTDDGSPAMSDSETITITVNEVNQAPVLTSPGNQTIDEESNLSFTLSASDADIPANTLSYSISSGQLAGMSLNSATGAFSWTPTEAQGPGSYTVTFTVTDNGSPAMSDSETITITVNEVNVAPTLNGVPATATVDELVPYSFTASATDTDVPAQTLTFSLIGAPSGASINPMTGVFSWTPSEAQGPGSYPFTVRVSDGVVNTDANITITVNEVNVAPELASIGNKMVDEETPLTFTATATDSDLPANSLTFSLVGAPSGASITSGGVFTWTPTEAQGPGSYTFTVRVTDDGSPNLSDEEEITVTVNEVNKAPVLDPIANQTVDELALLSVTAHATDEDVPANTLTYSLTSSPSGMTINGSTGAISWTPTEAQGPGDYNVTVQVSDGTTTASTSFSVHVNEVNVAPELATIGNKMVDEETQLTFTATATDSDLPANSLTFSLVGAPSGASITSGGVFTWTPTEAQGPGSYTFTVKVTDNGSPAMSDEESITVTVNEVNKAPELASIGAKTVDEGSPLTFTASATDGDDPANTLTYSLVGPPPGASINPTTGAFTWTPTDGPATYTFTVKVTDNGTPVLSDEEEITVTVKNVAPSVSISGAASVNEGSTYTLTLNEGTDPGTDTISGWTINWGDGNTQTVSGSPASVTHVYTDGLNNYTISATATDEDGTYDTNTVAVTVNNVNPTVDGGDDATINEGETFSQSGSFTDPGADTWTATVDYGDGSGPQMLTLNPDKTFDLLHQYLNNGTYTVTIKVIDDEGEGTDTLTLTVNNVAPTVTITGPATGYLAAVNTPITFAGSFWDPGILDTHTAVWTFKDNSQPGPGISLTGSVTEANGNGTVSNSYSFAAAGVYNITLKVTDNYGDFGIATIVNNDPDLPAFVVVYDPNGGFVTGGGWINSPPGAMPSAPLAEGKASFGFVSKYNKGQSVPTGNTEFQFKAGNLNFKSTSYDWLVISGARAQYKGSGTINGDGNYGFILTAIDGQVSGGGGYDKFRVKIWDKASGDIVYDNQMNASDSANPTTLLGGGSIVIHK